MPLLVRWERLERLEDAELGAGDHGPRSIGFRNSKRIGAGVEVVETADVVRLIAEDGSAVGDTDVGLETDALRDLYRHMVRARRLDRECMALQRQGELTVYPPFEGQEAAQVGSAFALGADDFAFPSFRELAAALVRGVDAVEYLEYHRGTWHGGPYDPYATGFAPICVPVATQIVHAVGWALGAKLERKPASALAYFGDGSTSEGDFHEAANMAAVFAAPVVLFCQNNGWAISVPPEEQYAAPIVARAAGYGMPGVRVDGNDVLAVYAETKKAVDRARSGGGPTLIEAITYRIGPHSTADDATRYRPADDVEAWRRRDPIARYRTWLLANEHADEAFVVACDDDAQAWVTEVRVGVTSAPDASPDELNAYTFARWSHGPEPADA
jgi:2-oxoisovalerate dehydrogenase E1 component alpha subunit